VRRAARRRAGGFRRRFDRPLRQDLNGQPDLGGPSSRFGGRPPRGPHAPFHLHDRCLPPPPFRCPGARTMVNDSLLTMCVRHPAAAEPEEQKEPRAAVVDWFYRVRGPPNYVEVLRLALLVAACCEPVSEVTSWAVLLAPEPRGSPSRAPRGRQGTLRCGTRPSPEYPRL
jgi:hypothetical protein